MAERPKLLFLSQRFLFPADTGGKIRTSKILEQLRRDFHVVLLGNVDGDEAVRFREALAAAADTFVGVPRREVPRHSVRYYIRTAARAMSRYPITALNDYSAALERALLDTIDRHGPFALLVCDFVQSALLFRRVAHPATLLFQHNVESAIPARHARTERNAVMRRFWASQARKMREFEGTASRAFSGVIAVSDEDRRTMESLYGLRHVYTIPTGVDTDYFQPSGKDDDGRTVAFCGSMDWLPNEDGVDFFLESIWERVRSRRPDARFLVIGRNPSPGLTRRAAAASGVSLTGWVDDVRPHLEASGVVVVPLRIGGGTRMKIYEAMAMGRAVVSTTLGAEGLPVHAGTHLFLEDVPEAFADRVVWLLEHPEARKAIGNAARAWVHEHFRWEHVGEVFAGACRDVIARAR